jgi:PAS domain S-box-containing protein
MEPSEQKIIDPYYMNRLILESAGEGIYGLDAEGRTTFVNPAAERMTGYSAKEMIGNCQHKLTHHSKQDGAPYSDKQCPIYAAFKDGKVHTVSHEVFWRKDGTCFPV